MKISVPARLIVVIGAVLLGCVLPVTATQATKQDAIFHWRGHTASVAVEIVRGGDLVAAFAGVTPPPISESRRSR